MARLPVLFVPGLGGSFNLPVLLDWRGPTINGWGFPPFLDYGATFLDSFTQAGYTRDKDLFVAFYDWRKAVKDSANLYLIPWIDRAIERSGSKQVVLVAHSMGGLVSRSYIQSDEYRDRRDVARLIALGTPHRGAANSYYTWEGGLMNWDSIAATVMQVYVWYLEHIHPFQTGLNMLRTIRTLAPGLRDLLPIDDYLVNQATPPQTLPESAMQQRNQWVALLNNPDGLNTLFDRVPVTTITGQGLTTLSGLVVQPPGAPTSDPPPYPDGVPVGEQTTGAGDKTVPFASAQLADPRARNLPSVNVVHDHLPDQTVGLVLAELGEAQPTTQPQPAATRLVIMTASPVKMSVELPAPAAAPGATLGSEAEAKPSSRPSRRKARVYDYGHKGKHLNMAVIPQPNLGSYQVKLHGTESGTFSLVAIMVGVQGQAVLGASPDELAGQQSSAWPSATAQGRVAAETELHYQVECRSYAASPELHFDAQSTARDALERIGGAMQPPAPAVLGEEAPSLPTVLGIEDAPPEIRTAISAAVLGSDSAAADQVAASLSGATLSAPALPALNRVVEQMVAPRDKTLAAGLIEQLRQVVQLSGEPGA